MSIKLIHTILGLREMITKTEINNSLISNLKMISKIKKTTPQKIRSYKVKQYPFWRIDKPKNVEIIKNGGWHFSFLNTISKIQLKLKSYAHTEYNKNKFINKKNLSSKIKNYKDIFNNKVNLEKILIDNTYPHYIVKNKKKFKKWIV